MSHAIKLYINLLKNCVSNFIYDDDLDLMQGTGVALDSETGNYITLEPKPADPTMKYIGGIWPSRAHTMIGIPRLNNLQYCVETVIKEGIPGDFIETGVWRGGASIFMAGLLKVYGITDRQVWVADSFKGLPPPNFERYPQESEIEFHRIKCLAVSLDEVRQNFERYDLLSDRIRFLQGWFRDTLPTAPIQQLAIMRLDGDLYESTMDGLVHLYPKLSPGGFVIIDDYHSVQSCNDAVADFCREQADVIEVIPLTNGGAYWRKEC